MWCVTIGSHQQQKIIIKVQNGAERKKNLKLSFRGWETTVIMSQELGKHMLVCCCWNQGASLRLRFGNMKGFVGWAGELALIQGLIAREAGSKLLIVGQGKEFGYIFQRGPQLQTNRGNRLLNKPSCPHSNPLFCSCSRSERLTPTWPNLKWRWIRGKGTEKVSPGVGSAAPLSSAPMQAWGAGSRLTYLEGVFGKQSRLCVVLLQTIKLFNLISIFQRIHRGQSAMCKGNREEAAVCGSQYSQDCTFHRVKRNMPSL